MKVFAALAVLASIAVGSPGALAQSPSTLDQIKNRGALNCGGNIGLAGFGVPDAQGHWRGLDVDLCRAIAAAIFNDANKVKFIPLNAKDRFTVLQSGDIDVLSRNSTWTMSREATLGVLFAGINYYDGQGFLIRKSLNIKSAKQLDGATVCTQTGSTSELNVADYFRANKLKYEFVAFATNEDGIKAYEAGRCDAYTTEVSALYAERLRLSKPEEHVVLPEIISKEPLGPLVRNTDANWFNVVKWVHFAMLNAEELGVSQKNVQEMLKSDNPEVRRLLGTEGKFGESIGLPNDWVVRIITHVGNYGEIFERNVGMDSGLKIARGQNALWTNGGLQYAPPIR